MIDEPKTFEVRCNARVLVFHEKGNGTPQRQYVLGCDDMDFVEFHKTYLDAVRISEAINVNGECDKWFLFAVADCYDPPICLVNADSLDDAYEWFITDCHWCVVEEPDLKDYAKTNEDGEVDYPSLTMNDNGEWCETDNIWYGEAKLIRVEC